MYKRILLFIILIVAGLELKAQDEAVQMSGVVMTNDSIPRAIPFAHVFVGQGTRGTMTDAEGFFSFAAKTGDSIRFSCIGFEREVLVVPDTLSRKAYLTRIVLDRDTTLLEEVTLYPWPTPDRFKAEFLATNIPTTQNDIAMRNLAVQTLRARAAAMGISADEAADMAIQLQNQSIYNYGRYQGFDNGGTAILGALTNPFAWQQLFQSFKK